MTSTTPPVAAPTRSPWFRSAQFDLVFILATPLLTWPLVMLGLATWGPDLLNQLILLTATGHYFPTFVRAYGDRELFARFRVRLILTPIVLLVTCVGMFVSGNSAALLVVTAAWAFWHWLAQGFGFARIYDIKVGSFDRRTSWLDKALVITGFVGAITLNDGATAEFAKTILSGGLPLPDASQFVIVEQIVMAAMALVATAYIANLAWTIIQGRPWSWQKQLMHVTTIGYYWFAFAWLPNVIVAYVLYEFFHDIQYYAISWLTCRQRVTRPGVTPWLSFIFRPGLMAALGFIILMSSFGGIQILGRNILSPQDLSHQVWLGLFLTFALLHYYYDGFIWKARENTLGADLGIAEGLRDKVVPGLRHAAYWLLFFGPMFALMAFGNLERSPRERVEALVALAPGDFLNQSELGLQLAQAGEIKAALEHYKISIDLNPNLSQSRLNYGAALDFDGQHEEAIVQYRAALACLDSGNSHSQTHINLGVLLFLSGEDAAADEQWKAGAALGAEPPINRILGMAGALPPKAVDRRRELYSAALKLDPSQLAARFELANLLLAGRQFQAAAEHFTILTQRAPRVASGIVGLASAQYELGQHEKARKTLQRAIELTPTDPMVLTLKARLGMR